MLHRCRFLFVCLLVLSAGGAFSADPPTDLSALKAMKARAVGPAGMSGRVTAVAAASGRQDTLFVGTASGGLWRSTSGGIAWTPLFDAQPSASIGALAVHALNPDLIWAGTGEGNPRNSQSSGRGVFQSRDGGVTWTDRGLTDTRNIHRLLLHPHDPDTIWVGAQGDAWHPSEARGVYKSTDGGATWRKVLYVDPTTGVADLVMDPHNPDKLMCAMWQFERKPWTFQSGGPGSGLHISWDGGETWKRLTEENGLPKGDLGRIGLAIAPSNSARAYALIESAKNALYRSDDGGRNWTKVADKNIGSRPFYYADIYVDPHNENRIFNLHSVVTVSQDAGKTFDTLIPYASVHPDHHAFWIHPENPDYMLEGNDGGMAISRDGGSTWRFVENLPLAQFYHIRTDMEIPYNIYGGMQDNGSWRGPSRVWAAGGIRNSYWEEVGFGDGFDVVPDPSDTRFGYAMSQGGALFRYDRETGFQKTIRPQAADDTALRFNWNAALASDPFDPAGLYFGSQFVHHSTDKGETWTILSPDLTTNDPQKQQQLSSGGLTYDTTQAENFTTITAIAPSTLARDMLWVGTDDGRLHLTRNGGADWKDLSKQLKGLPDGTWIPYIYPSTYSADEAFVIADNHRRGDWTPYVYYTKNGGAAWRRLVKAEDMPGYALALVQDPEVPDLLFLGTETGLYVSFNFGQAWHKWTAGFPTVPTMDLTLHPREHDLVIGTFGRAAYVLDDIRPLRVLAREGMDVLKAPARIFPIPVAYQASWKQATGTRFAADAAFQGENHPRGAVISLVYNPPAETSPAAEGDDAATELPADTGEDKDKKRLKVEILDREGRLIRSLQPEVEPGFNRITWALDRRGPKPLNKRDKAPDPKDEEPGGPGVAPGTYTVRFTSGTDMASGDIVVLPDPRRAASGDLAERNRLLEALIEAQDQLADDLGRLRDASDTIARVKGRLGDDKGETAKALTEIGKKTSTRIDALFELVVQKEVQGILRDPDKTSARLSNAMGRLYPPAPASADDRAAAAQALAATEAVRAEIAGFFTETWAAYRARVTEADLTFFKE